MGWWNSREDGTSLQCDPTGLVWGDGPADVMDAALEQDVQLPYEEREAMWALAMEEIRQDFQAAHQRDPTKQEVLAGALFSLGAVRSFAYKMEDGPAPAPQQTAPGMLNVGPLSDAEWTGLGAFMAEVEDDG